GHVMALHRFGIAAGAPMFIPGLGAFIRLRQLHMDPIEDSRVGLAGPLYGFGAAIFAYAVYSATGWKAWQAIAHFGAFINLFNLIPVWQLDGARGWRSLAYQQRLQITGLMALLWVGTSEPLLLILALVAGFRCFKRSDAAEQPDTVGFWQFGGVLVGLSLLAMLAKTSLTGSE
ncbi:MAG: site-2 protease family protein, partial [Bryobacteraceae bacterium]|nr:site-2 protease family protein [Bryobacteraceae bacterium]